MKKQSDFVIKAFNIKLVVNK